MFSLIVNVMSVSGCDSSTCQDWSAPSERGAPIVFNTISIRAHQLRDVFLHPSYHF
jgi:hypothetical protein